LASRDKNRFNRRVLTEAAIIVAFIIYGSIYPFTFRQPVDGVGPLRTLLQSWAETPRRGDFVANIFFYLPFGFFASLAIGRSRAFPRILVVRTGVELTQYYIAERVSAAIAFAVWLLLADSVSARIRVTRIALLFSGHVILERLAPFEFTTYGRAFGWIPFHSFLYGSLELNIVSFLEKAFLYGAMIWLLDMSGLRLGISIILVAVVLFATSCAETYLPGRSAEITDALMALLIGAIIAVVKTPAEGAGDGTA
jgi:hypothetical protein